MTREEHLTLWRTHAADATRELRLALQATRESNWTEWQIHYDAYRTADRLATKHWGIAEAIWTRKYGKNGERIR